MHTEKVNFSHLRWPHVPHEPPQNDSYLALLAWSHSPRSCGVYRANANVLRSLRSKKRNGIVDISFCIIERKKNNKKNLVQAFQSLKPRIIRIHIQLIQN